ncbi:hypothetical protein [Dyella nitratireducens]|uniref:hypothetical protein n=1 Tax=Dyella nitratireducens TaxID=1849580 RepID=UPI001667A279|nr:hypothetical protein [Dyella nitratireducens]
MSLHVKDIPDAMIDASGSLSIDGKSIAVTSPQRGLLMLYQRAVMDVHDTGLAMGKIGAGMGTQAIKNAVDGKSKAEQDKDAEAGSAKMDQLFQKMCDDEASIKSLQDQLAVQLPAFKPYGSILSSEEVTECYKDKH